MDEQLVMVCQRHSSSGLPVYLEGGFSAQGREVEMADFEALQARRYWSLIRTAHPSKQRWFRRREVFNFYSVAAWHRNTRANGRLVDRALRSGGRILQVGGLYFPHPAFAEMEYYLFFTYTMKLAFSDGYSPWVVEPDERDSFVALETQLYQHATHIFVAASFVKRSLVEEYGVPPERISVVGMGVDEWYLEQMEGWPRSLTKRCLFVGFTWELKGGPDVVRAFELARQQVPDLTLSIIGPNPSDAMQRPGISALGPVRDKSALLEHYRSADLFVLPSRCDSFGFVFLEAMSQGVVCLGSNLNAMPEIIEDRKTGFIVEPGDQEGMARLMVDFYRAPGRKEEMGALARERVKQHFTWPRVTEAMAQVMFGPDHQAPRAP